jgi:predicted amidophosphoribosyltransferase
MFVLVVQNYFCKKAKKGEGKMPQFECPNCAVELYQISLFCPCCGVPLPVDLEVKKSVCPKCGQSTAQPGLLSIPNYCGSCGFFLGGGQTTPKLATRLEEIITSWEEVASWFPPRKPFSEATAADIYKSCANELREALG